MTDTDATPSIQITGPHSAAQDQILTADALEFVAALQRRFNHRRRWLLDERLRRHAAIQRGRLPTLLPETAAIRAGDWQITPVPPALQRRWVEITGPVDRKMVINALNSGADMFMADFEDANSPTRSNNIEGQLNLRDAIRGDITYEHPSKGTYRLNDVTATLLVRPRGWHLDEAHMLVDGQPVSGALFDFGLYLFHNARALLAKGAGPFFYLAKLESHLEARLWADVFSFAEDMLGLDRSSIRATVLLETILLSFEIEEVLWELRRHIVGINAGRWDYIFSAIKKFRDDPTRILPDRAQVTMTAPFMRAYTDLLVHTCHKRGAHAIGGMAAFIPSGDPAANEAVFTKVRDDKTRELNDGFDGTWVAHPGLVRPVHDLFLARLGDAPHQKSNLRDDVAPAIAIAKLIDLTIPGGKITEAGVRLNINVGLQYIDSWLKGVGAAAIHNLMEDAATAEISRSQLWQWLHHSATLDDGRTMTRSLYDELVASELEKIKADHGLDLSSSAALDILNQLVTDDEFAEFLTLIAYPRLNEA
jgi:malate synthase